MDMAHKDRDGEWVVREEITIDRYDLEGTIDSIYAALNLVRDRARAMGMKGEGTVDLSVTNGWYDSYELEVRYNFERYEYPAETERREAAAAKAKEEAKAKRKAAAEKRKLKNDPEYAEFERLKAKFGG
jgi:hypothetical protein